MSPLPREARPYQGRRAGLVTRLVAAALDGVVVALVLVAGYAALSAALFIIDPRRFTFPAPGLFLSLTSAFVVLVVYLTISWSLSGRTYGCLVMGLRVVDPHGHRLPVPRALLRAAFCAIVPIGLFWVAVSSQSRSLQDLFLRTSVVYDWQPRNGKPG